MQHALACKGMDRSYDSGKFKLSEKYVITARKSRIFVINPLSTDVFLVQDAEVLDSSWIEELVLYHHNFQINLLLL